jgi:D-alanine-D-alanine ligase
VAKIRVGILFGGRSAEHEVSLLSARNIYNSLDKQKYDPILIGIDKNGQWCLREEWCLREDAVSVLNRTETSLPALSDASDPVTLITRNNECLIAPLSNTNQALKIDVIFPILHGTYGEDGTVQGLLKLADIPFVGPSVLGSAVGMDKDVMKRLLRDAGIPSARFITGYKSKIKELSYDKISKELGKVIFVKPANLGSSVGISKVENESQFSKAIEYAFQFDTKIIIEEGIVGRELECAVLGNEEPIASGVGEIIPASKHGFYSYDAKYIDADGAKAIVRADLEPEVREKIKQIAIQTFQVLCCEGLSRVDVFLRGKDEVLVNEINTIPGFTPISMYPKLWEDAGLSTSKLIDRLIELAIERFKREKNLKTSVS